MSYIIAFVTFSKNGNKFPVECFRDDLMAGDGVIIRRADKTLRLAEITEIQFLNWDCKGRIECKVEESSIDANGNIILPKKCPIVHGITTHNLFISALKAKGWIPIKSRMRTFFAILACQNIDSTSYIFVRRNGIDIQILPRKKDVPIKPYSYYEEAFNTGKTVRHALAHTTFNLFEGLLRYADSFLNNETDLERYFIKQGEKDKRTDEQKERARKERLSHRNEMRDIYEACSSGDGEDGYMGDGLWISSSGSINDYGR